MAKKQWAFRWLTVAIAHLTIGCTNFRNTKREVYCYSLKFDNFDMSYLYKNGRTVVRVLPSKRQANLQLCQLHAEQS